jgi:hypothetical protein
MNRLKKRNDYLLYRLSSQRKRIKYFSERRKKRGQERQERAARIEKETGRSEYQEQELIQATGREIQNIGLLERKIKATQDEIKTITRTNKK